MQTFAQRQDQATKRAAVPVPPTVRGPGPSRDAQVLMTLQRTHGNLALLRTLAARAGGHQTGGTGTTPDTLPAVARARPSAAGAVQPKLEKEGPDDENEREANQVAQQVMRMPETQPRRDACDCRGECPGCRERVTGKAHLRMKLPGPGGTGSEAPPIVHEALHSPGRPLPSATRTFFEPRLGRDLGSVRVHTDALAARSADALEASAYTVGTDVVFASGQYSPETGAGRHLLAHELAHVVQQRGAGRSLQRFHRPHGADPGHQVDERSAIAPTFADMQAVIRNIITASTHPGTDHLSMEDLVLNSGGQPATRAIDQALGTHSTPPGQSMLTYRYLFTCRCGLIDMRHFLQLLYISNFTAAAFPGTSGNRAATRRGREHELTSESESRFGPEDTPSNALGAFTGARLAAMPRPDDLFNTIRDTLVRCDPVGFATLSAASRDIILHHYGDLTPDAAGNLVPLHQNQTAVPDVLGIPECGGRERSFPFTLDTDDPDRKTISDTAFDRGSSGLTSDSDIREFVATQRPEIIRALPAAEKVRLVQRLFSGYVHDEDIDAIEVIYTHSSDAEKARIRGAVDPDDLMSIGQRTRMRLIFSR